MIWALKEHLSGYVTASPRSTHLQPAAIEALIAAHQCRRHRDAVQEGREVGAAAGLAVQQRFAGPAAGSGGGPLAESQVREGLPVVRLGPAGAQGRRLLAVENRLQWGSGL